jgi:hypothetical protein
MLLREQTPRAFENRVLRKIFEPKGDKITGRQDNRDWRRLHYVELNDLYSSPNIIWVTISIKIRHTGHVACILGFGEVTRMKETTWRSVNGRKTLKWNCKK